MSAAPTPPVTFQTVRLSKGGHRSPDQGVCVMELASMLAEEPFSDRPRCACELIGAFLRCYNDAVDDRRRQDLFACAASVVGTRDPALEPRRAELCAAAMGEVVATMTRWRRLQYRLRQPERAICWDSNRDVARTAARLLAAAGEAGHQRALALIDEMVTVGAGSVQLRAEPVVGEPERPKPPAMREQAG